MASHRHRERRGRSARPAPRFVTEHPEGRTMTSALALIAPEIKVNGALVGDLELDQLDGVRISRSLGLPGRAVLRFSDIGYSVAAGQVFGIGGEVEIGTPTGTTLF